MSIILGDIILPGYGAPQTLWEAFDDYAACHHEKIAIVASNGVMVSYGKLMMWAESIIEWIKDTGRGRGRVKGAEEDEGKKMKGVGSSGNHYFEIYADSSYSKIEKQSYTERGRNIDKKWNPTSLIKSENKSSNEIDQLHKYETAAMGVRSSSRGDKYVISDTRSPKVVGICLRQNPVLIPLILSIWKKNQAFIIIDPELPLLRTVKLLNNCQPEVVIGDSVTCQKLKEIVDKYRIPCTKRKGKSIITSDRKASKARLVEAPTVQNKTTIKCVPLILNIDDNSRNFNYLSKVNTKSNANRVREKKCSVSSTEESEDSFASLSRDVACIIHTSGTSSSPKFVRLTHRNLLNRINWQHSALPFERNEVCIMTRPFSAVDALTEILIPILGGIPLVVSNEDLSVPDLFVRILCQFGVTRLHLGPSQLNSLLDYLAKSRSASILEKSIKLWSVTGKQINSKLLMKFYDIFPESKLINLYGCTETSGDITCYGITERCLLVNGKVPVGSSIYNNAVLVTKEEEGDTVVVNEGKLGDILCFGINVFEGYDCAKSNIVSPSEAFIQLSDIHFQDVSCMENVIDFCKDLEQFEPGSRKDSSTSDISEKIMPNLYNKNALNLCDNLLMNRKIQEKLSNTLNVDISFLKSSSRRRSSGSLFLIPSNTLRSRSSSMCSSLLTAEPSSILGSTPRRSSMPPSLTGSTGNCTSRFSTSNTSLILSTGNINSRFSSKNASGTSSPLRSCESERVSPTTSGCADSAYKSSRTQKHHHMVGNFNRCRSIPTIVCSILPHGTSSSMINKITASSMELSRTETKTDKLLRKRINNSCTKFNKNAASGENLCNSDENKPNFYSSKLKNYSTIEQILTEMNTDLHRIKDSKLLVFRTGDVGRIIGGILTLEGRSDFKVSVNGSIVDCEEIEEAIANLRLVIVIIDIINII